MADMYKKRDALIKELNNCYDMNFQIIQSKLDNINMQILRLKFRG